MGYKIELDLSKDLTLSLDREVTFFETFANNTMSLENDGLYVSARPGQDGTGGTGYDDYYTNEGIRLGYSNPYSDNTTARRVTGMHYVHRLYDASLSDTVPAVLTPLNFRPAIDYVLAGDMCRVDQGDGTYKHYLVTQTSSNTITAYEDMGVW